ncbi:glycogen synthase [Rhodohalobacter sp. 8-1]|uniref:glycogen synthase n=1 Tax=Rhodohalobacter sp. 8-1 TaxID=3131972 RepID=UPI0030EF258B
MNITHISAECYPAAKAGGLGDVVGALPKYLNKAGDEAMVVLPYYQTDWLKEIDTDFIYEGTFPFDGKSLSFSVCRVEKKVLGFELYLISIPGRFDRPGIYIDPWSGHPYWDEMERFFSFQIAALEWLNNRQNKPDIIHCHDHHTALVPFMMKECFRFDEFKEIPSVLTIHNGEYQGKYPADVYRTLPAFNLENLGILEWDKQVNCLAAGIKTAWKVTTVSEGYMQELLDDCNGLEHLLRQEEQKTAGIVNGIDVDVWNPKTDPLLEKNFTVRSIVKGKDLNKHALCDQFSVPADRPLFAFIGRLVREKGADMIPDLITTCHNRGIEASFIVLGTGDPALHDILRKLVDTHVGYFDSRLEYNEKLAHQIYAGSDFLMMPSRVEPCGLNQFYAMRYGTIPVVRKTGGLADTVIDISEPNGYGIVFKNFNLEEFVESVERGVDVFNQKELFEKNRKEIMKLDFSWNRSTEKYIELYKSLISKQI